jgi:hypothetical protein
VNDPSTLLFLLRYPVSNPPYGLDEFVPGCATWLWYAHRT